MKRKKKTYTVKAYSRQEDGNLKPLARAITPVEGLVLDLALSFYNSGEEEFTALDLLATGKKYIDRANTSYSQIQEIEGAVCTLRDTFISVTPKYEEASQLLPVFISGKATLAKDKTLKVWRFGGVPVLLTVSREVFKGVLEYPSELLAIGNARGLEGLALKKYLLDRVYYCSAQKGRYASQGRARNILFQTVYEHLYGAGEGKGKGQDPRKASQKRRLRERTIDLIDAYAKSEICPLKAYTVYNTHKSSSGNSIGFHLLFGEEGIDQTAQKARDGFEVSSKRGGETLEN